MELKEPLSYSDQLKRLKEHHMIIENDHDAETFLRKVNYYRLSGYAFQFKQDGSDDYPEGTSFNHVKQIYSFDEELRNMLYKYLGIVEIYYRCQISNGFVMRKCVNPPHDQHYNESNYYKKKEFIDIRDRFESKQANYYKETLITKHHKAKYGNKFPLWVMVEMLSFSDLSKLYSTMYESEQIAIAGSVHTGHKELENHLHILSVLRNKCAHASRLYNGEYNPPAHFSKKFLKKHPEVRNDTLFAYIIVLTKRLPGYQDKLCLVREIERLLDKYQSYIDRSLIGFPENAIRILLDII